MTPLDINDSDMICEPETCISGWNCWDGRRFAFFFFLFNRKCVIMLVLLWDLKRYKEKRVLT